MAVSFWIRLDATFRFCNDHFLKLENFVGGGVLATLYGLYGMCRWTGYGYGFRPPSRPITEQCL